MKYSIGKIIRSGRPSKIAVENMESIKSLWIDIGSLSINVTYGSDPRLMITYSGEEWDFEHDLTEELTK